MLLLRPVVVWPRLLLRGPVTRTGPGGSPVPALCNAATVASSTSSSAAASSSVTAAAAAAAADEKPLLRRQVLEELGWKQRCELLY